MRFTRRKPKFYLFINIEKNNIIILDKNINLYKKDCQTMMNIMRNVFKITGKAKILKHTLDKLELIYNEDYYITAKIK
jgi:hypothetical protein